MLLGAPGQVSLRTPFEGSCIQRLTELGVSCSLGACPSAAQMLPNLDLRSSAVAAAHQHKNIGKSDSAWNSLA